MKAPILLLISILLYVGAIVWGILRGEDTFLTGLLAGCGSIAMGVWIGMELMFYPELVLKEEDDPTKESESDREGWEQ